MSTRKYKMKKRARDQEHTRQKIVAATVALHGSLGPGKTTISAVAEKAGVQRLTVYRHFPTDESLFLACSSHWLEENPPPDPEEWEDDLDAARMTATALASIYGYYRRTSSMWRLVYRDVDDVPAMQGPLDEFHAYLRTIRDGLVAKWQPKGRKSKLLQATVAHMLAFGTWDSLQRQQLGDADIVRLGLQWISSAQPSASGK
jgi:AcrR family transcriptional regulator